ncbi:uncharacterized protein RSE6_14318 [Rhynchosporium secalis]|uniref:Uncharacterized protein n=1 Tax=Rhynchosporium secalis TaxID=38038 RepID=A0A1E1MV17_RHYSE|nr:uncharacterized protein RSE6_14318 [Rhynchosporium secalis]
MGEHRTRKITIIIAIHASAASAKDTGKERRREGAGIQGFCGLKDIMVSERGRKKAANNVAMILVIDALMRKYFLN